MKMSRNTAGCLALYIAAAAWAAPSLSATPAAAAGTSPLNDTGQTACFDDDGLAVDCAGTGRDGETGRDVTQNRPGNGKAGFAFIKIGPGGEALPQKAAEWACVEDKVTGLVWEGKTEDGGLHDGDNRYFNRGDGAPDDASGLVAAVNQVGFCGHADWRLPTQAELHSLVYYQPAGGELMIDKAWFPNTAPEETWTSTARLTLLGNYAGFVHFGNGFISILPRYRPSAVRLVRSGDRTQPPAAERWILAGDEATDTTTGLTWRRCAEGQTWTGSTCTTPVPAPFELAKRGFAQAKKEAQRTGKPWRVPNVKELASLIDLSQPDGAIDPVVFPNVIGFHHLTSTHDMNRPGLYWGVRGSDGFIWTARKFSLRLVRNAE